MRFLFIFTAFLAAHLLQGKEHAAKPAIDKHIRQHSISLGGTESGTRQIGDTNLDRDDNEEVAVLYCLGKNNDVLWFLAIFEEDDGKKWYLTDQVYLGGRGLRHIDTFVVNKDSVVIDAREFQGDDPYSSPTLKVRLTISNEHGLLQVNRRPANDEKSPASAPDELDFPKLSNAELGILEMNELETKNGLYYRKGSKSPFTGIVEIGKTDDGIGLIEFYENGRKTSPKIDKRPIEEILKDLEPTIEERLRPKATDGALIDGSRQ